MATKKEQSLRKASVKKAPMGGLPGHEQDPKRRLGNFSGAGEHPRVGNRSSGIGGQTTKTFGTDNKRSKSTKSKKSA